MIYTIGYQKISIEQLEEIMDIKEIGLLIDVRSHPYSRNPMKHDFNKNRLMERFGERYAWMGDRCGGKYGPAKAECLKKLLFLHTPPLERNLLLMCMENHPFDCHRYSDIGRRLLAIGVHTIHLFDGTEAEISELIEAEKQQKGGLL